MNPRSLRPGMMVEYHNDAMQVVEVDQEHHRSVLKRPSDNHLFDASCNDIHEDPQLHTDCNQYY